ncbi:MAG TPA: hypothetical protein VFD70_24640 [Anaerolineae bacterium]|nr:hypothetical protein [Anaerolineae bacterium]
MKSAQTIALKPDEQSALDVLFAYELSGKRVFIVEATSNIFKEWYEDVREVRDFQNRVEILVSARYWRRWARRLQEFGFTREDARVLSLGTFGTDNAKTFLGVAEILTFDQPMVNLFAERRKQIQQKLDAMKLNIESPYNQAQLPDVRLVAAEANKRK